MGRRLVSSAAHGVKRDHVLVRLSPNFVAATPEGSPNLSSSGYPHQAPNSGRLWWQPPGNGSHPGMGSSSFGSNHITSMSQICAPQHSAPSQPPGGARRWWHPPGNGTQTMVAPNCERGAKGPRAPRTLIEASAERIDAVAPKRAQVAVWRGPWRVRQQPPKRGTACALKQGAGTEEEQIPKRERQQDQKPWAARSNARFR